jgi:hypothetical protein
MRTTFREYLASNDHVALVCIFHESFETKELPEKHRLYRDATVVRGIQGEWTIGKKIRFYSYLESIPSDTKTDVGALKYIFLDAPPQREVFLDTGSIWSFQPELDAILQNKKR